MCEGRRSGLPERSRSGDIRHPRRRTGAGRFLRSGRNDGWEVDRRRREAPGGVSGRDGIRARRNGAALPLPNRTRLPPVKQGG